MALGAINNVDATICDIWTENDLGDNNRVAKCSTLNSCIDPRRDQYSDTLCTSTESCGEWLDNGTN